MAPFGLIVKLCPKHIAPEFTVIIGLAFTIIILTAEFEQPAIFVPVTVKTWKLKQNYVMQVNNFEFFMISTPEVSVI